MAVNTKGYTGKGYKAGTIKPLSQVDSIVTVADVSSSLANTYWFISSTTTDYYIWLNLGSGVDPAIPNRTGVAVTGISANATAAQIATAVASALTAVSGPVFKAISTGSTIKVWHVTGGIPGFDTSAETSGFTITRLVEPVNASGPFAFELFTTPPDADFSYEVEVTLSPSIITSTSFALPAAGILWGMESPMENRPVENVSSGTGGVGINGQTIGSTGTNSIIRSGGRYKIKVGPDSPVSVSGMAYGSLEKYAISWNVIGYKLT